VINKTEIKKVFSRKKVQVNKEAMAMVEDHLMKEVEIMTNRLVDDNVKRLTPELFWVALGNYNHN